MRRALIVVVLALVAITVFVVGNAFGEDPFQASVSGTRYAVDVRIASPGTGPVVVDVLVRTGSPDTVTISTVMPSMGHAVPETAAPLAEPRHFTVKGTLFPMAGVWEITIRLSGTTGTETLTVNALIT
ncbi:hypothetical protein ACIBG8_04140 [Nonomuraea sp. NPDC050556]|uniref:hypothetical protein n=1 Tax=Nonomuraea sp. NPDC050556 TaxID=3364369 RepID=UPI0037BA837C